MPAVKDGQYKTVWKTSTHIECQIITSYSSAVAEMGDSLATIDMGCAPLGGAKLGAQLPT